MLMIASGSRAYAICKETQRRRYSVGRNYLTQPCVTQACFQDVIGAKRPELHKRRNRAQTLPPCCSPRSRSRANRRERFLPKSRATRGFIPAETFREFLKTRRIYRGATLRYQISVITYQNIPAPEALADIVRRDRGLGQRTLVDGVTAALREAILAGEIPSGEALTLREVADQLSVSVMPVREALRALANEGFVELLPHRGARVARLSPGDLADLYDLRVAVETAALRATMSHLTAADYDRLAELLDSRRRTRGLEPSAHAERVHREFHFGIYGLGQSKWFSGAIAPLWEASERYRRLAIRRRRVPEFRWDEHAPILSAMRRGDADRAALLLEKHLRKTHDMLAQYLLADKVAVAVGG